MYINRIAMNALSRDLPVNVDMPLKKEHVKESSCRPSWRCASLIVSNPRTQPMTADSYRNARCTTLPKEPLAKKSGSSEIPWEMGSQPEDARPLPLQWVGVQCGARLRAQLLPPS